MVHPEMNDFLIWLLAVPIAVTVVLGIFLGLGYVFLRLISLFSRRMAHPRFGEMRYFMGVWEATGVAAGVKDVFFAIPGNRNGPSDDAVRMIDMVEKAWTDLEPEFLRRFSKEILESDYPEMSPDVPDAAERMDQARLRSVTQLSDISI